MLISPFEAAPLTPAVARAMKAGIPVIELDRKTNRGRRARTTRRSSAATITRSPTRRAIYVAKTLLPDGGEVAVLEGLPSSTPAVSGSTASRTA